MKKLLDERTKIFLLIFQNSAYSYVCALLSIDLFSFLDRVSSFLHISSMYNTSILFLY